MLALRRHTVCPPRSKAALFHEYCTLHKWMKCPREYERIALPLFCSHQKRYTKNPQNRPNNDQKCTCTSYHTTRLK